MGYESPSRSYRADAIIDLWTTASIARGVSIQLSTRPPDSNGLVDNYDDLYPSNHWKVPSTYLRWLSTVEESITNGLNNGFV